MLSLLKIKYFLGDVQKSKIYYTGYLFGRIPNIIILTQSIESSRFVLALINYWFKHNLVLNYSTVLKCKNFIIERLFINMLLDPGENGVSHQETVSSLDLMNGYRYHTRVKVFNQAGLYSSYSTDGVTVDSTPPFVNYVRIGTPKQQEDIINGIVG